MNMRYIGFICVLFMILIAAQAWGAAGDVEKIQQAIQASGGHWIAGQTPFTDLTLEQKKARLGLIGPPNQELRKNLPPFPYHVDQVDEEVDWRNRNGGNWVTPIRDQGQCGSCWAFGCTAALESNMMIAANQPSFPLDLSEQYLVSCSPGSCDGYYAEGTLSFMENQGQTDEVCLPYGATDNILCMDRCDEWQFRLSKVASWGAANGVQAMKNALMSGPITATYEVFEDFYSYVSGVYYHTWGQSVGWHLICIVGYSDSQQAWICKNSWGPGFGMAGYFMIRMYTDECSIESGCDWLLPATADYPFLNVSGTQVNDEIVGEGDGVMNPGETADLQVGLVNGLLTAPATGVTATISCSDPRVTILDDQGSYSNLAAGQTVYNTGNPFRFSVASNCPIGPAEFTMLITANEGNPIPYVVERQFSVDISYNQPGYPLTGSEIDGSPAVCDLNGDGIPDVVSGDFGGYLRAVTGQGQSLPGFPYHIQGFIKSSPAVADLDNDGDLEIVFSGWLGNLYVLNSDGTPALDPINLGFFTSATPALGDLDGDGTMEMVVGSWNGKMYAFHHDGTPVSGFPFDAGNLQCITDGALLLDINGDQLPEILFGSNNHLFYALSGTGQELWHYDLGDVPAGSAVAAEFSPGVTTIIVADAGGHVHYLTTSGQQVRSVNLGAGCKSDPSIADLNADGQLEISVNDLAGGVHMLNMDGQEITGFPVYTEIPIYASSSFADIDNDGWLDLIVADLNGNLRAFTHTGASLTPFPIPLGTGTRCTPTIANVDPDSYLEIVLGTYGGLAAVDSKLDAGTTGAWNMYRGNLRRTGYYGDGSYTGVTPGKPGVQPELPKVFALLPAHPNPFNPTTVIGFQLPQAAHVSVQVFDLAGRLVATLVDGNQEAGTHQVSFNGSSLASGLYFARMRAGSFNAVQKVLLVK